jgi:serine/threonine protein kinase
MHACTQGFHFHASKKNPRLEIYSELGCSLEDLMPDDEGSPRLGLGLVQKVMSALVGALAHLHERGVVHR